MILTFAQFPNRSAPTNARPLRSFVAGVAVPPQPSSMTGGSWVSMRQLRKKMQPPALRKPLEPDEEAAVIAVLIAFQRGQRAKVDDHRSR